MQHEGASGIFMAVVAVVLGSIVLSGAGLLVLRDDAPAILGGTPGATVTEVAAALATQPRVASPTPMPTRTPTLTLTPTGTSTPVRSASRTPTPEPAVTYTVRPGDALELIAGRYGVTSTAIVEENGLVPPYVLEVGQVLVIPVEE